MKRYLVVDGNGVAYGSADSHEAAASEAVREARAAGGEAFDATAAPEEQQNPPVSPKIALERMLVGMDLSQASVQLDANGHMGDADFASLSQQRPDGSFGGLFSEELVMGMSKDEAVARLYVFQEAAVQASEKSLGKSYLDMSKVGAWFGVDGWFLKSNAKIAKGSKIGTPGVGLGVVLVPERTVLARHSAAGQPFNELPTISEVSGWEVPRKFTLCAGASAECEKSCLIASGQNVGGGQNVNNTKYVRTLAFLKEPVAFLRGLVASIEAYLRARSVTIEDVRIELTADVERYLRLNVFSDIPWEYVCPWLFKRFSTIKFYDYTKVPGRDFAGQLGYDLSFSFSGTNWKQVEAELQAGRRSVFVFVAPQWETGQQRARSGAKPGQLPVQISSPDLFGGQPIPVVDGDLTDFRPRDPGQCIVGLRWKFPQLKDSGARKFPELRDQLVASKSRFVVLGDVVSTPEGESFVLAEAHGTSGVSTPIEPKQTAAEAAAYVPGHRFSKSNPDNLSPRDRMREIPNMCWNCRTWIMPGTDLCPVCWAGQFDRANPGRRGLYRANPLLAIVGNPGGDASLQAELRRLQAETAATGAPLVGEWQRLAARAARQGKAIEVGRPEMREPPTHVSPEPREHRFSGTSHAAGSEDLVNTKDEHGSDAWAFMPVLAATARIVDSRASGECMQCGEQTQSRSPLEGDDGEPLCRRCMESSLAHGHMHVDHDPPIPECPTCRSEARSNPGDEDARELLRAAQTGDRQAAIKLAAHVQRTRPIAPARTLKEQGAAIFDMLEAAGWRMSAPTLKIRHATSPDGTVTLWLKPQVIYASGGKQFKNARHFDSINGAYAMLVHGGLDRFVSAALRSGDWNAEHYASNPGDDLKAQAQAGDVAALDALAKQAMATNDVPLAEWVLETGSRLIDDANPMVLQHEIDATAVLSPLDGWIYGQKQKALAKRGRRYGRETHRDDRSNPSRKAPGSPVAASPLVEPPFLPLEVIEHYAALSRALGYVWEDTFLQAYRKAKGDPRRLSDKIRRRRIAIAEAYAPVLAKTGCFYPDKIENGHPALTPDHYYTIFWGYSPEPQSLAPMALATE